MGRVANLNNDIRVLQKAVASKEMTIERAAELSKSISLEHIAKSLCWYMDRVEKMDRYEPVENTGDVIISKEELAKELRKRLDSYGKSSELNTKEYELIIGLPIEEWLDEIFGIKVNADESNKETE